MNLELKKKLIKLAIGALVAGAVAALTYFTAGLKDLFPILPAAIFAGNTWAIFTV